MSLVSYALISLADLKEALSITGTSDDALLTNIINRATDIIERYCNGRRFASTTYTNEEYDGTGTNYINLKHYPITSLTAYEKNTGSLGNPNWEALESDYITYLGDEGQVYYELGPFERGVKNYRFSYVAGYSTIPNDLQQACITLCSYLKNVTKGTGLRSESLGEYSYTKEEDVNATIKNLGLDEILDVYKTPVI